MFQSMLLLMAADFQSMIGLIILVLAICKWVVSWFQDARPNIPPPRPRQRQDNSGQSERERFLEEIGKKNGTRQNPSGSPRTVRPESSDKKKTKPRPAAAANAAKSSGQQKPVATRPVSRLAQGSLLSPSGLGDGVRSHVATHLETRNVDAQVQRDVDAAVQRDINANVEKDVGTNLGKDSTRTAQRAESVHPMIQLLRNPQGVRQAILMSEILKRPKSLK